MSRAANDREESQCNNPKSAFIGHRLPPLQVEVRVVRVQNSPASFRRSFDRRYLLDPEILFTYDRNKLEKL
jgi:hypothetical protein